MSNDYLEAIKDKKLKEVIIKAYNDTRQINKKQKEYKEYEVDLDKHGKTVDEFYDKYDLNILKSKRDLEKLDIKDEELKKFIIGMHRVIFDISDVRGTEIDINRQSKDFADFDNEPWNDSDIINISELSSRELTKLAEKAHNNWIKGLKKFPAEESDYIKKVLRLYGKNKLDINQLNVNDLMKLSEVFSDDDWIRCLIQFPKSEKADFLVTVLKMSYVWNELFFRKTREYLKGIGTEKVDKGDLIFTEINKHYGNVLSEFLDIKKLIYEEKDGNMGSAYMQKFLADYLTLYQEFFGDEIECKAEYEVDRFNTIAGRIEGVELSETEAHNIIRNICENVFDISGFNIQKPEKTIEDEKRKVNEIETKASSAYKKHSKPLQKVKNINNEKNKQKKELGKIRTFLKYGAKLTNYGKLSMKKKNVR